MDGQSSEPLVPSAKYQRSDAMATVHGVRVLPLKDKLEQGKDIS
jgi:hypothetical protein